MCVYTAKLGNTLVCVEDVIVSKHTQKNHTSKIDPCWMYRTELVNLSVNLHVWDTPLVLSNTKQHACTVFVARSAW